MKKSILILVVILACSLVLAACDGGSGGGAAGGGRSLVLLMEPMEEDEVEEFEEMFMGPLRAAFPDDQIDYDIVHDRQTMQVQVAAGAGPDIIFLDGPTDAVEFFKSDRIISLDDYAEQYGWRPLFYEWAYDSGYFDGQLISLPNSFEGMMLYINNTVFEENGWDPPTNIREWEAIMDEAAELGISGMAFGNSDYQGAVDWLYSVFMNSYPGPDALRDALEGRTRVDEGLVLASMELMQEWWERGYWSHGMALGMSMDDMTAMFADGRAAMMINGTWAVGGLLGTYSYADWSADLIPEMRDGVGRIMSLATGGVFCINAASEEPDFAAEVLNELFTNTEAHLAFVNATYFQPFPIHAFDLSKMTDWDPAVVDLYQDLIDAIDAGDVGFCAWTFFPSDMRVYMNENTDNMFMGFLTPQEFMTQAQTFVDRALADGTAPVIP